MATTFEVLVVHPDERYARQAAAAAFDLADRLGRRLSVSISAAGFTTRLKVPLTLP